MGHSTVLRLAGCAIGLMVAGPVAWAAPAPSPGAVSPLSGPNQQPLPVPPYAQPGGSLAPAPPGRPHAPDIAPGEAVLFNDLLVASDIARRPVWPRRRWRPPSRSAGALGLEIAPREQMDGAWVRRQFQANGLIGAPTTTDRIVALVALINQAYAQNGYVNSGVVVPRQTWSGAGGVLRLRLIFGRLAAAGGSAIKVSWASGGSQGMSAKYIRDRLPSVVQAPLNTIDLERDFRLLADDPAIRTINAQLTPGAAAGEANLSLSVAPQPLVDAYAGVANSRNPSVGAVRIYGGAVFRNLPASGDVLAADVGETSGLLDAVVDYATPFFAPRLTFDVQGLYDGAAVVDPAVRRLDIRSTEESVEGGLTAHVLESPLTPTTDGTGWTPAQSLDIGVRAAQQHSSSLLGGEPFSFTPGAVNGVTDTTVLRFVGTFVQRSQSAALATSATVSVGLAGTGSDIVGVAAPDPHFRTVLFQANYARRLFDGLEFHARFSGQWSSSLLYSMERLSAGGEDTVRGYRENLLLADSGAIGSLELACPLTPGKRFCAAAEDWRTLRVSVFSDAAHLYNHAAPQPAPPSLASVGVSAAWSPSPAFFARVSYGYALIRPPQSGPIDLEDRGVSFVITTHPISVLEDWLHWSRRP